MPRSRASVATQEMRTRVTQLNESVFKPSVKTLRRALVRTLERRARIRTTADIPPEALGFESGYLGYMASSWTTLTRILRRSEVSDDDVFVDFGCGMGRVLYQAATRYALRRVEGVELSPELAAVAQENLDRNRHKFRARDVRVVACNVLEYEIPDDLTIAYLYNPFQGEVFQTFVDRLVESVQRRPRRLRVIYLNALEEQRLLDAGFREIRRLRGIRPDGPWRARMYELAAR